MASVPSGASTGIYEAVERRDGDPKRYSGKGVLGTVGSICKQISPEIVGCYSSEQSTIDRLLCELDGTENKSKLGANAILAVSLANARACASSYQVPLYRWLGGCRAVRLPIPMMNIINGGVHASNNVEMQEFMIVPIGAPSFADALRMGSEIYHSLGRLLKSEMLSVSVGDEGGYAPSLESDEQAIEYIINAIEQAGYTTDEVKIALDAAASEWYDEESGKYVMPKRGRGFDRSSLSAYWKTLVEKYPIISIEDPLDQRDFEGWSDLTREIGDRVMLVGDDLFVTNPKRLKQGIEAGSANAILVKPNQIGTLSEVIETVDYAKANGYKTIMSHRSGETADTFISDLAVALGCELIKTGAPARSERTEKYNRLMKIESEMFNPAYAGELF
jgi:enolase